MLKDDDSRDAKGYESLRADYVKSTSAINSDNVSSGPVDVDAANDALAQHVWKQLFVDLRKANKEMKKVLSKLGVQENDMSPFIREFNGDLMSDLMEPIKNVFPSTFDWESYTPVDNDFEENDSNDIYQHLVEQCMETIRKSANDSNDADEEAPSDTADVSGDGLVETKEAIASDENGGLINVNSVAVEALAGRDLQQSDIRISLAFQDVMDFGNEEDGICEVPGKISMFMDQLTMKEREVGAITVATKAMSLTCRYTLKRESNNTIAAVNRDNIQRDSIIVLSDNDKQEELHYRVLGVFKKYYNKWFHSKPDEVPPSFSRQNPPNIRLSLRLLTSELIARTTVFSTVKTYDNYEASLVHRNIQAKDILRIEGHLSPATY